MTLQSRPVTLDSRIAVSGDVMVQEVGGEIVLLDMATEHYFGLDAIGTRIWQLIDQHGFLRDVHDRLCSEYGEEPGHIAEDLLVLVQSLLTAGLVRHGG